MIVDFKTIGIDDKPVLVLKTPSGKVIQTLGYARNPECQFRFNETSQITFEVPAYVNGEPIPNYEKIVGEMLVDVVGWGVFVLQNPKIEKDGIKEIKACTAYSREYELTHKQISLEEGTYNFWNPAAPEGTIIGLILESCPGWHAGSIDSDLIGRYRTFDAQQDNAYNIMMNGLQKPYKCVFYFDTYKRTINAVDANSSVSKSQVFLSLDNLVKKIDIDEKSENLVTVLDVYGADGVDIRITNPLGTNKIYNLDYFMNDFYFDKETISAWKSWKELYEERRQEYFALSVRRAMKTSEIITLEARKTDEEGEMTTIESEQAVNIQASANGDATGEIAGKLVELKESADKQAAKIAATQAEIDALNGQNEAILTEIKKINEEVSFKKNFTEEQLAELNSYFIENSLTEASFAMTEQSAFTDTSMTVNDKDISMTVTECELMKLSPRAGMPDEQIYFFQKGNIELSYDSTASDGRITKYKIECEVNSGSAEKNGDKFVTTAQLGAGAINNITSGNSVDFTGGTFTIVGTYVSMTDDTTADENVPNVLYTGKSLTCSSTKSDMYITRETTMMEQYATSWALYDYAEKELKKVAYPTYTFKLDTANFLAIEDFVSFTSHLTLGRRCYLDTGDYILTPILIGVDVAFDDLSSFSLTFSDTYHGGDNAFNLVDLLEQSVSMGHKLDMSKFSYNDYVNSGARTAVHDFMTNALDASRNAVINGNDQAIKLDETGLHLRKANEMGEFEDEQIWIINNNIVFTDDGWETAKMALGHFVDENTGLDNWGLVAPNIVGTLFAGENLVIEAPKPSINGGPSGRSLFRVDENGASLYNSRIEIINPLNPTSDGTARFGDIVLDPEIGIGLGVYEREYSTSTSGGERIDGIVQTDFHGVRKWNADKTEGSYTEEGRVKFWVDMDGNLHFKGTLEGADGVFTGSLKIGDPDGKKTGTPKGVYLDSEGNLAIGGIYSPEDTTMGHDPKANFYVDNLGNMYAKSGKVEGDMYVNDLFFKDPDLDDWVSILDDHNKIKSKYLDLGNIILDGETGDVKILGNIDLGSATAINFGTFHPGIEYEYSADGETDWHKNKRPTDKYSRVVTITPSIDQDGNPTEERIYADPQKLPEDWPAYIQSTYIDMNQVAGQSMLGNNMYAKFFHVVSDFTQKADGSYMPGPSLGTMGAMNGYDGVSSTNGMGFWRDDNHYILCTDAGSRMQSGPISSTAYSDGGGSVCTMANRTYMTQGNMAFVDVVNANAGRSIGAAMYYGTSYDAATGRLAVTNNYVEARAEGGKTVLSVGSNISMTATQFGASMTLKSDGDFTAEAERGSMSVKGNSGLSLDSSNGTTMTGRFINITSSSGGTVINSGDATLIQYQGANRFASRSDESEMSFGSSYIKTQYNKIWISSSGQFDMGGTTVNLTSSGNTKINTGGTFAVEYSGGRRFASGSDGAYMQWGGTGNTIQVTTGGVLAQYAGTYKLMLNGTDGAVLKSSDNAFFATTSRNTVIHDWSSEVELTGWDVSLKASEFWFTVTAGGTSDASDARLKENIRYDINGDIVDRLRPARFNYIGNDKVSYGFIAQDVQEVFPDLVTESNKDSEGESYLGLLYNGFIPLLTAKIQKQTKQIAALESRIAALES